MFRYSSQWSRWPVDWGPYRLAVLLVGVALIVVAVSADALGHGRPGDFGRGQWIALLAGAMVVAFAIAGLKRFVTWYRSAALILLNTILLLVCLELAAIVIARSGLLEPTTRLPEYRKLDFYRNQTWGDALWDEAARAEQYQYAPYTLWQHRPFSGELLNINEDATRLTPGADCGQDAYTIFMLGGSSMWGWGSPDWATIPANVQRTLSQDSDASICVINLGEDAFVSTQSLIAVMRQLQAGRAPDLVVSFDGVNDVYAAYASGMAGVLTNRADVAQRLHGDDEPLGYWLTGTRTAELVRRALHNEDSEIPAWLKGKDDTELRAVVRALAAAVRDTYLSNKKMLEALGKEYGFDVMYFWPPQLATTAKPLTGEETVMKSKIHPVWAEIAVESTRLLCDPEDPAGGPQCLTDALDDFEETVYIDDWSHMTPAANRQIARRIVEGVSGRGLL